MEWAKTRAAALRPRGQQRPAVLDRRADGGARRRSRWTATTKTAIAPLVEAIAARYGVLPARHDRAGPSGANFLVCAALLEPGDDVLVERPGYDPLLGAPRLLGARVVRFDRDSTAASRSIPIACGRR